MRLCGWRKQNGPEADAYSFRCRVEDHAHWINRYHWDWYAVLTFRDSISTRTAWKKFNDWRIEIKKHSRNRIDYFMAIELDKWRGQPHLHVFLSGTGKEKPYIWAKVWFTSGGIAKIVRYNPNLGASYYLAEKWVGQKAEIKFSRGFFREGEGRLLCSAVEEVDVKEL